MKSARLLLCVLALLPSACFTPRVDYDQASAILANPAGRCCADLKETPPVAVKAGGSFGITAKSPIHRFDDGDSFYAMLDIGGLPSGEALSVASHMTANGHEQRMFYPAVLVLDDRFNIIRKVTPGEGELRTDMFNGGPRMDLKVPVGGTAAAQYLVVYTTPTIMKEGKFIPRTERDPMGAYKMGGLVGVAIDQMIDHPPLPQFGEIPYPGAPVSGESSITLYVLRSIADKGPAN